MALAQARGRPTLLKARRRHTWWFALFALAALLFTQSRWASAGWVHEELEWLGYAAVAVAVLGRVWCAAYIGGRKNDEIVALGPYSVVRNPLYVFSFIGAAGVGLGSGTLTVPLALVAAFAVYYQFVVEREETFLAAHFGADYVRYAACVPRWLPDFGQWRDAPELAVKPRFLLLAIRDSAMFFMALPLLEAIEWLQSIGYLPVILRLP